MAIATAKAMPKNQQDKSLRRPQTMRWGYGLIVIAIALMVEALVVQNGIARTLSMVGPQAVLRIAPWDARANAAMADLLLVPDASAAAKASAGQFAARALSRDPTIVEAARNSGFIAELNGNGQRAALALQYAERLSRRDLGTQLWLLEDNVKHGNVAGALVHFDVALRTSPQSGRLLIPILVSAIDDPRLIAPIAGLLAARPFWSEGYLVAVAQTGTNNRATSDLLTAMARRKTPVPRYILDTLTKRFVSAGDYRLGWKIYQQFYPHRPALLLRDGGFEEDGAAVAFEWQAVDTPGVSAERIAVGNITTITMKSTPDAAGPALRQMLVLPKGRYTLRGTAAPPSFSQNDRPYFSVACAEAPAAEIGRVELGRGNSFAGTFDVPAQNCSTQWLTLLIPASEGGDGSAGDIDNLTLVASS